MRRALSLVDRGWAGARACSLALAREPDIRVTHLIRGRLAPEVLGIITPHPMIRLADAPKRWYSLWLAATLAREALTGQLRWVFFDHERRWARLRPLIERLGAVPVLIIERGAAYELRVGESQLTAEQLLQGGLS